MSSSLKFEPLADLFLFSALHMRLNSIRWCEEQRGKYFCRFLLCLFDFIIKNVMIFKKLRTKTNILTVQIFYNLQNIPIFHSEERLVKLARGRDCFVGLSILLVYGSKPLERDRTPLSGGKTGRKNCAQCSQELDFHTIYMNLFCHGDREMYNPAPSGYKVCPKSSRI